MGFGANRMYWLMKTLGRHYLHTFITGTNCTASVRIFLKCRLPIFVIEYLRSFSPEAFLWIEFTGTVSSNAPVKKPLASSYQDFSKMT